MTPLLFKGDATTFTGAGLGALPECTFCEVTEERNGIFECEFKYPVNGQMFRQIRPGCIVYVSCNVSGNKQPFDIYSFSVDITGMATFRAQHISYRTNRLMFHPNYPIGGTLKNGRTGVLTLLNGYNSLYNLNFLPYAISPRCIAQGFSSVDTENPYIRIDMPKMMSYREIVMGGENSIIGQSGAEIRWDGIECIISKRRGKDSTAVIRIGNNLSGITYEYDVGDKRDAYIPYWIDQDADYVMNKYLMTDMQSVARSYPDGAIASPCVYDHVYTRGDRFTAAPLDVTGAFNKNVTDDNPDGLPTADDVYDYAYNEYHSKNIGQAYENLTIDFQPLWQSPEYSRYVAPAEKLKLCDTAQVFIPELGVNKRMKVCKTVWDVLQEKYTRLEFGSSQRTIFTVGYDNGTAEETAEGTVIIDDTPI